jgi:Zn-dependent peptidase ImmA (M78 family)
MAAGQKVEALTAQACRRETIEDNAPRSDRIEWQAGYICGALLMPKRRIELLVRRFLSMQSGSPLLVAGSTDAEELVERVTISFRVSRLAARVRLGRLGVITDEIYSHS